MQPGSHGKAQIANPEEFESRLMELQGILQPIIGSRSLLIAFPDLPAAAASVALFGLLVVVPLPPVPPPCYSLPGAATANPRQPNMRSGVGRLTHLIYVEKILVSY